MKVPLKVIWMYISGISEYSTPMNATFKASVTLNNGTVHTSDTHPLYFEWDHDNDFDLIEDNGYGVFNLRGQGKSGHIYCSYYSPSVGSTTFASHYIKFVEIVGTAEFVSAVAYFKKIKKEDVFLGKVLEYTLSIVCLSCYWDRK